MQLTQRTNRNLKPRHHQAGFTLAELIVVLGVFAVGAVIVTIIVLVLIILFGAAFG